MLNRSFRGGLALVALLGVAFVLLCAVGALFYWFSLEKQLDEFCAKKSWGDCISLVASDISLQWPFAAAPRAGQPTPAQLVQSYFADLSGKATERSAELSVPSAEAAAVISDRAWFYERQWQLTNLSEAYVRCSVGLYRKRAKDALQKLDKDALKKVDTGEIQKVDKDKQGAAESLAALARSLRRLAEIYQRHGKYLIAERALKECTDVATQAFALADKQNAERFRAEVLVDYGAHIKILNELGRTPEAERESKLLLEQ